MEPEGITFLSHVPHISFCLLMIVVSFTKDETRSMAENWVNIEDDPDIIDTEVDEAIELLDDATFLVMKFTMP